MKKIRCDARSDDYVKVSCQYGSVEIYAREGSETTEITLSPDKIRKLRKQIKRALIEIKGDEVAHDHP